MQSSSFKIATCENFQRWKMLLYSREAHSGTEATAIRHVRYMTKILLSQRLYGNWLSEISFVSLA